MAEIIDETLENDPLNARPLKRAVQGKHWDYEEEPEQ